ncbi:stage V sporulation protein B [Bacillus sp. UMB0893]|uniref:stage V sporulation protein B n=1 Tax=Bacillus sp. UMB0893 TaxID=2066053 RepID=UPI000C786AAC|nr:stage V sporulation protein B [Bacillus sp. UMB0893]PLR68258.1 stage V sporulation protein B [Bacillus sp. UMB0893]
MSKQTFLQGTIILIAAGLITRVLGFINRIVVARFIGEEGVGLYMMAMPTLVLIITITQFGLPVAISKLVAEAEAEGNHRKIKKILVVSLAITGALSLLFTPAIILLAPYLSNSLLTDPRTLYPLLAISPVVPIIAISSVLRGYFQGKQNMRPAAISQVLEQIVRISLIAVFTKTFLPYGIEYAAAGAMASAVVGELISLIYLFSMFKMKKKFRIRRKFFKSLHDGKDTFQNLMSIALPTTGSRMIGSIAWFFEPIVVAQSLAIAGFTATMATKQYGELTGYALPLLMLPSFITYSLSTALVPAISEAMAQNKLNVVQHRLQQAFRLSLVTGGFAVVILYIYAKPMMTVMYGNSHAAMFVQVMAPFFIFYYFQGPLQAVLQALNLAKAAMINSFIGSAIKTALIFLLATRPSLGIMGAALAIVAGIMLVTLLHLATVMKVISLTIRIGEYARCILTMIITAAAGYYFYPLLSLGTGLNLIISVIFTFTVYGILLVGFRLVHKEEIRRIPFAGIYLSYFVPRSK